MHAPPITEPVKEENLLPVERRLFPQKFSASSHLENDWNKFEENYLAIYLGDDNPKTAWTDGKADVGLGETISVEHTPLEDASKLRLEIRNGYQKTSRLFGRNARAKDITLKLLPSGITSKYTLSDAEGWQSLSAEQPPGPLKGYEIRFDSVYKGTHYEDLVVSDIQTYVTALTPDNPGFETSKQKRLLEWVEGRKLAAKTFKEAAQDSIPVAANYRAQEASDTQAADDYCEVDCPLPFKRASQKWGKGTPLFGALDAAALEGFLDWKEVRISVLDKRRIPQADSFKFPGIWSGNDLVYIGDEAAITLPIPGQLAYFSSQGLKRTFVEASPVSASTIIKGNVPGCKKEGEGANFFFAPTQEGPLTTLLIVTCGLYEDRDGYSSGTYWQLLTYAEDGRLEHIFDSYSAYAFAWVNRNGVPFLKEVARVSTAGAADTTFVAR